MRRAETVGTAREQQLAIHLEEPHRVLVDVDQPVLIEIDDHDDLGRMLDQRSIARLAVTQRRFGRLAVGGITQTDDVDRLAIELRLADRELGGKGRAVEVQAECLVRSEIDLCVVQTRGELLELFRDRLLWPVVAAGS